MYYYVSFVGRGKTRIKILKTLYNPRTPTEAANITGIHRSSVSRTILDLEKKGLVECLTPKEKRGRYYRTTKLGKEVIKILEGRENGN
jgi:DNA-binding MarR family transcriptional regulator